MIRICVLGAGVIGLSTAVNVIEQLSGKLSSPHIEVTLISEQFSPNTTSDGSGGFWEPYLVGDTPKELVLKWGRVTLQHMIDLSGSKLAGELGACTLSGYRLSRTKQQSPVWTELVPSFREMEEKELKNFPGFKFGFTHTTVMIECKKYLPWLLQRFKECGGQILQRKIERLGELFSDFDIIVNCTGLGSYHLLGDEEIKPNRGQVIRVRAPWIKHFAMEDDENEITGYILPGANSVVLGGSTGPGQWHTTVNQHTKRQIMEKCLKLVPSLQDAEHLEDWVGLRPNRSKVRLEREEVIHKGKVIHVVHNYGHSGAGVTLHWGCAQEATQLVGEAIRKVNINLSKL